MKHKEQTPDYRKIYNDMILMKYPDKAEVCKNILTKKSIGMLDVIKLNQILVGESSKDTSELDGKLRSYDKETIFEILEYQKNNKLSNSELSRHFKLSRNSITKWKKYFYLISK
ncbi:helix-turn-helix domain-containing protein [Chryseobacterium cucumeris]|uniref:helix-turn-helix domain-containing protein n=1 Tax=Chryseobacterium cucumeris TaxID=1813611 RepID=UPI0023F579E2|nr:helix-turn-helix domain-containing protein [Chryseobacterium cucumeris]